MKHGWVGVVYALVMVLVIVGLDLAFFRHHPLERLFANVAVVLVFGAVFLLLVRNR